MDYIGKRIKNLRKIRGFSQRDLSQGICSQSELSKIENSKLYPSLYVCYEISKKLDITIDELIENEFDLAEKCQIEEIINLFYMQRYSECLILIEKLSSLQVSQNRQLVCYILGASKYYLSRDINNSIEILENSLDETYTDFKKSYLPIEIQILNLLGTLYKEKKSSKCDIYISKSLMMIHSNLPKDIHYRALSKCFYNSAKIYLEQGNKIAARKAVLSGIKWGINNQTLYYLSNLYELLITINIELDEHHLIKKTKKIINSLKLINESYV